MDIGKLYITGARGLVGKNLLENEEISQYEILSPSHQELDLLDYNAVVDYIASNKPDLIIHTAGQVGGIQANMNDPYGFLTNNLIMGVNLVKGAKACGIKNFLNLSSSCTYPCNALNPLKEDMILTGSFEITNEGYAIAKTAILKMCEYLTKQFEGYYYKTLIPCNLYGRYDKFSLQNSHLIPSIIKKIHDAYVNNIDTIEIWGDGISRREFMYASDFADIVAQIIKNFDKIPCVMNIGLGKDFTINEYYDIVSKIVGYKGHFTHVLTRPSGMRQKLLDVSKQKEFGFLAKSSLEEGIQKTYEYFLKEYK